MIYKCDNNYVRASSEQHAFEKYRRFVSAQNPSLKMLRRDSVKITRVTPADVPNTTRVID